MAMILPFLSLACWLAFGSNTIGVMLVAMFFSAMPLAWAWSLVYRFIEGREQADIIGAFLSASFVLGACDARLAPQC